VTGTALGGRSIVVTRARAQAPSLVERLTALGANVVELPVIAVDEPADGGAALATAADRLASGAYRWVAVTSANAASRLLGALGGRPVPEGTAWAAVGVGTARVLAGGGHPPRLVPAEARAGALAAAFPMPGGGRGAIEGGEAMGHTVLFPRAETVRGGLAEGLRARGWSVDEVVAYRTVAVDPGPDATVAARRADAIAFTSSSTVDRTVELLGTAGIPPVVVSIGPVTSGSARAAGIEVAAEANPHTLEGVVDALVAALGGPAATGEAGPDPTGLP
jgi:uroporphyrinogen-III synthase